MFKLKSFHTFMHQFLIIRLSFKVFSYVYASKSFHTFMHQSLFISLQGTLFLDFRKAFDLVDQSILLRKLSTYKFSDATHKLLCSYDRNREQVMDSGKGLS